MYLKSLYGLVSSGHIREACQLARKYRDFRLTLLLAQCGRSSAIARDLLKKQLTVWGKIGADNMISPERLRVYIVLAGFILWETEERLLSSCEEVEWQRNLAVQLWSVHVLYTVNSCMHSTNMCSLNCVCWEAFLLLM